MWPWGWYQSPSCRSWWRCRLAWVWSGSLCRRGRSSLFSNFYIENYDNVLDLVEWNGQEFDLELHVLHHGFECLLGFVFVAWEEEQDFLLVEVVGVVVYLLLLAVCVELFQLPLLVVVVLNLPIKVKPRPFLVWHCLLLLLFTINKKVLVGKKRYARLSS